MPAILVAVALPDGPDGGPPCGSAGLAGEHPSGPDQTPKGHGVPSPKRGRSSSQDTVAAVCNMQGDAGGAGLGISTDWKRSQSPPGAMRNGQVDDDSTPGHQAVQVDLLLAGSSSSAE